MLFDQQPMYEHFPVYICLDVSDSEENLINMSIAYPEWSGERL